MTVSSDRPAAAPADDEATILAWASTVLRWRRVIALAGIIGVLGGLAYGVLSPRVFTSSATFIPEATQTAVSGLAAAASQFGIQVPSSGGGWGPAMYAEVLRSYTLRAPIVMDTFVVSEENGRRATLAELLEVAPSTPSLQAEYGVRAMEKIVSVSEAIPLGAVRLSVTTKWPSISFAVANRLVQGVNDFNLKTRKSQASAERQFNELQAKDASDSLRAAEQELLAFLKSNRSLAAPELTMEQEHLQRKVSLQMQVYTSLLQSREEAKMREVRDTPVITLIEAPRLAALGASHRSIQKALLGGIAGVILAVVFAFMVDGLRSLSLRSTSDSRQFLTLASEATPAFLKRLWH